MQLFKLYIIIFLSFFIISCNEKTIYTGKIIDEDKIQNINISNKNILIEKFGQPSFIDPIENKYFYFSEKEKNKNIYMKKTEYSYLFVFKLNEDDKVISKNVYNLLDKTNAAIVSEETENNIIKRGLLEKIFGGVGPQKMPNTSP
tara:strand:- start:10812 stop:11246 length:435 start_codon:yes stop_codon:yes gene_type:complete